MAYQLQELRKLRYLTQEQLAEASGVSIATIKDIERGARLNIKCDTLRKLAAALDVSPRELL